MVDMMPHDRSDLRETMGHVWQGFSAEQVRQWGEDAGFAECRVSALPAAPHARGPNLFAAVFRKH
jgi:hypothetical protein